MKPNVRIRRAVPPLFALLSAVLLLRFPGVATEAALDGMTLSVRRLIPLLFPYTVLSVLVVRRGWIQSGDRLARLFRLPREACGVLVTGWAAGFPVGAAGAAELYGSGKISRSDAERLIAVSSVPSPAFLVGAVGGMRRDPAFGWLLWILSVLTAAVLSFLSGRGTSERENGSPTLPPVPSAPFPSDLSRAVTDAASCCLSVTAFVVFFRVLCAVTGMLVPPLAPVLTLTLELSAAARFASSVPGIAGAALTGAAVGFGSLSVFGQIAAKTADRGLSSGRYLRSRLVLAPVLAAGAAVHAALRPMAAAAPAFSPASVPPEILFSVLTLVSLPLLVLPDSRE